MKVADLKKCLSSSGISLQSLDKNRTEPLRESEHVVQSK